MCGDTSIVCKTAKKTSLNLFFLLLFVKTYCTDRSTMACSTWQSLHMPGFWTQQESPAFLEEILQLCSQVKELLDKRGLQTHLKFLELANAVVTNWQPSPAQHTQHWEITPCSGQSDAFPSFLKSMVLFFLRILPEDRETQTINNSSYSALSPIL